MDFQSTVGPNDSVRQSKIEERMSRAHSSVLLLNNTKSHRDLNDEDQEEVEAEEDN